MSNPNDSGIRRLTLRLSESADDLRTSNARLRAVINIGLELASERDLDRLALEHEMSERLAAEALLRTERHRQLLERHPGLKVIYMSGCTDDALARHGVVAFLRKPFNARSLEQKLRDVVGRPGRVVV